MKKLLGISMLLIAFIFGYFLFYYQKNESIADLNHTPVTLKLLPFPLIIANDGSKSDKPLDLLLQKKNVDISIINGLIEIDNTVPFGTNILFKNASIHFAYNEKENKVTFSGSLHNLDHTKISGDYYLDEKNNIIYNLNFNSDLYNFILVGSYSYIEGKDETLTGSFSFNTKDIVKLVDYANNHDYQKIGINANQNHSLSINGDFNLQETKLSIKNATIKSELIDGSINLDFANDNQATLSTLMHINNLNLDKFAETYDIAKLDTQLIKIVIAGNINDLLNKYATGDFNAKINIDNISFRNDSVQNIELDIDSNKNGFVVSKLNLDLPGGSVFNSSGLISTNKIRPQYQGNISLNGQDLKSLVHYLYSGTEMLELQDNIAINATANILITPVLNSMQNIQLNSTAGSLLSKWAMSDYGRQKIIHSDISINGFKIDTGYLLKSNPLSDLVRKSNQPDFVDRIMQLKSIESVHDIDIELKNVNFNNHFLNQAQGEFILKPELAALNRIKVKADNLKFSGDISLDTHGVTPLLNIGLIGDNFDSGFVKYLTYEKEIPAPTIGASNPTSPNSISMFRFDKFIGYIQLNFNSLKNKYMSASDFNFMATLKDGAMYIDKFTASVFGGDLDLKGNLSFMPFSSNITYSLSNAEANSLGQDIFKSNIFGGNVSIAGNLNSIGFTSDDIESQLNGTMQVKSNNLSVDNFNIESFVAIYGKAHNSAIGRKLNLKTGSTNFSAIHADILINKGLFSSDKVDFETDSNINGASSFNFLLPSKQMNNITSFAYVDQQGTIDGFNISLNGPIDNLKMQLGSGS